MAFQVDNSKIVKNTFALYFRLAITMVIAFFTSRVTLEQLGVDDYGLNNLVGSAVSMLTFLNSSMGTAIQRFYSIEIGRNDVKSLKKIFGVGLSLHFFIAVITILFAEFFALLFLHRLNIPVERMFAAKVVFQISLVSLFLNILVVPYSAMLRAKEMFAKLATYDIIMSFLRLGVLYLLVHVDYDKLITLSVLNMFVSIYYFGCQLLLARTFVETHTRPLWDYGLAKKLLSFISMLIVTVLAQMANTNGIVFLINLSFSLTINAAYAIAMQVSNMVNNFIASFKQVVVPQMMSSYGANDIQTMHHIINWGSKMTFVLLVILSMPIVFETEFLLKLWLKNPPEYSSMLVSRVIIYVNIASFTYFHYQGVHATGKITGLQLLTSVLYLVNILLIWVVFKMGMSFEYAINVNIFISVIQSMVNLLCAHKYYDYNISDFLKKLLIPSLLVVSTTVPIMMLIITHVDESFSRFFLSCFCSTIILFYSSYFLLFNAGEKKKIHTFINNVIFHR